MKRSDNTARDLGAMLGAKIFAAALFSILASTFTPLACAAGAEPGKPYTPDPQKVLRYAFRVAETSFDPATVSDSYSVIALSAIFDSPLRYDYLARPVRMVPNTLAAMPEVSADFRTFTLRVKPGIYFADHEVFGGKKRELVAEDYVYSIKRLFDPKLRSPSVGEIESYLVGAAALQKRAQATGKMDYDTPLEGLRALDRYTFQVKLIEPGPRFMYVMANPAISSALAREVVERYGDDVGAHPLGTGAFTLSFWKRSSRMVFTYNPNFREAYFEGSPAPGDAIGQRVLATMKGKRLPQVSRVEVAVIEEEQPRYLSFLNNEFDLLFLVPGAYADISIPRNKLAPSLAAKGIQLGQDPGMEIRYIYFNMNDPVVGGYTPEKIALRRAISLGFRTDDEINIVRKGLAIRAYQPFATDVEGYDPNFKTSLSEYDPAKARALLDMFGYKDIDGDGFRELPDGTPLILKDNSTPSELSRQYDELMTRSMGAIGIRVSVSKAKFPDLLKDSNAGKLMMWRLGGGAENPDAANWLKSLYGPNAGPQGNRANFKLAAYDALFARSQSMPDGLARTKLIQQMSKLVVAYAPWRVTTHHIDADLWYPYVLGYRQQPIWTGEWWRFIDIDVPLMKKYEAKR